MKPTLIALLALFLLIPLVCTQTNATKSAATARPNIVYILADDMGYDLVSVNNAKGMGPLSTPNIDRLASQGMNFTDAHSASAVCTPTRYGLLTGRYCWRTELKKEVLWDYGRPLIEAQRLTVPELLKEQGYATAMVGKWHLGLNWYDKDGKLANENLKIDDAIWKRGPGQAERVLACQERIDWTKPIGGGPVAHGFDYFSGVDLPNMPPYAWIEQDRLPMIPSVPKPKEMFGHDGPMVPGWRLEDLLPLQAHKSAQWITDQSKTDQPFFLYMPLTSPHTPISPSAPFQGKSVNKYADFVVETDWVVGYVLQALEDAGVADNTLVIFTTDNGTAAACNFNALKEKGVDLKVHFKGQKAQIHDGGHRVPFIARWPGQIEAGATNSDVICLNDLMATLADLFDAELPDDAGEDSHSILPLLIGDATTLPDRPAVVHHDYRGNFAIRKGKWKLVLGETNQLFDMHADPKETTDLAEQHPEKAQQLAELLKTYQTSGRSRG